MKFNLGNLIVSTAVISLSCIAPSLAASITDVHLDDANEIIDQQSGVGGVGVLENYGETYLIPYPSHDGNAVVANKNGQVQWFDKILTLTPEDLAQPQTTAFFQINNTSPYHWSDYHFEFYNSGFTQKQSLPVAAFWINETSDPTLGAFDTAEAVLGGNVVGSSTTNSLDFLNADSLNFYSSPGVAPGQLWAAFIGFDSATLLDSGVCLVDADCNISIRQIATANPVPEPLTMLGAGVAISFGAAFKRRLRKGQKKA